MGAGDGTLAVAARDVGVGGRRGVGDGESGLVRRVLGSHPCPDLDESVAAGRDALEVELGVPAREIGRARVVTHSRAARGMGDAEELELDGELVDENDIVERRGHRGVRETKRVDELRADLRRVRTGFTEITRRVEGRQGRERWADGRIGLALGELSRRAAVQRVVGIERGRVRELGVRRDVRVDGRVKGDRQTGAGLEGFGVGPRPGDVARRRLGGVVEDGRRRGRRACDRVDEVRERRIA